MNRRWLGVVGSAAVLVLTVGTAQAAGGWTASTAVGVSGPVGSLSDTDAWALGNPGFAHWNGTSWQQFSAPAGRGTVLAINDVGPVDAWAVGFVPHGYHASSPQIEHWDGTAWSISASPAISARHATLNAVAAPARNNAWAVGNDGHRALVEHWNGSSWSRVTVPDPNATTSLGSQLTALTARSASDIWAIGTFANLAPLPDSLYALHYDGQAWSIVTMAQTASQSNSNSPLATSAVAIAANDVWMVGNQNNFGSPTTLTEHWDGTKWTIVASPFDHVPPSSNSISDGSLIGVTARSAHDVWAAGFYFTFTNGDPFGIYHALVIHWDGARWTRATLPSTGTYNTIQGISTTLGGHLIWATNSGSPGLFVHP